MKKFIVLLLSGSLFTSFAQTTTTKSTTPPKSSTTTNTPAATKSTTTKTTTTKTETPKPTSQGSLQEYIKQMKTDQGKTVTTPNPNAKPFPYTGSFTMNYQEKEKSGKLTKGVIKFAFDSYVASIMPTFPNMKALIHMNAVINIRDNEMVVLTTDTKNKKSGLITKIPDPLAVKKDTSKTPAKPPVVKKTGKIKTIQGLKCEEYLVNYGDTTTIESWVTTELNLNSADLLKLTNIGFKGRSPFGKTNLSAIKGTAIETTITEKNGKTMLITLSEIVKAKPSPALFSTDGYTLADARSLPVYAPRE